MSKVEGKKKWLLLILLQLVIMIYTLSGVAAKFAAGYEFLSMGFILCYGVEIFILGLYAIFWQQIIKRVDLSVAYANRSIAILWSMIWAALIFGEHISVQNIIGVLLVIAGTMIVNKEGKKMIYWLFLVASVVVASFSQILLKKSAAKKYDNVIKEYLNPYVIIGYAMMVGTTVLTILAYHGIEYKNGPVIESLGYILIMILSFFFFKEPITKRKVFGNALILLGIIVFYL